MTVQEARKILLDALPKDDTFFRINAQYEHNTLGTESVFWTVYANAVRHVPDCFHQAPTLAQAVEKLLADIPPVPVLVPLALSPFAVAFDDAQFEPAEASDAHPVTTCSRYPQDEEEDFYAADEREPSDEETDAEIQKNYDEL